MSDAKRGWYVRGQTASARPLPRWLAGTPGATNKNWPEGWFRNPPGQGPASRPQHGTASSMPSGSLASELLILRLLPCR